jgi:hypothetical protein
VSDQPEEPDPFQPTKIEANVEVPNPTKISGSPNTTTNINGFEKSKHTAGLIEKLFNNSQLDISTDKREDSSPELLDSDTPIKVKTLSVDNSSTSSSSFIVSENIPTFPNVINSDNQPPSVPERKSSNLKLPPKEVKAMTSNYLSCVNLTAPNSGLALIDTGAINANLKFLKNI